MKIEFAVVCDSVRREDNGKLLLIGVYGGAILVEDFPATLLLSLVMRVRPTVQVATDIEFRVTFEGKPLVSATATMKAESEESAFVMFPGIPLQFPTAGDILFQLRLPKEKWTTVTSLVVRKNDLSPSPSA